MPDNRIGRRVPRNFDKDNIAGRKRDPGPYVGIVKNNEDPVRSGRLQIWIPDFGGLETDQSHWLTVSYASPFIGAARIPQVKNAKTDENAYDSVNHAYGMWFTPPDLGNYVLVTFINGDTNRGYYFACIMPDLSHFAIPGQAGADNLETPKDPALAGALNIPPYPVVEFNELNRSVQEKWTDFLTANKPIHEKQAYILLEQGLEDDKTRGVVSSSSQRESPSKVFGISTPGNAGPLTDQDTGAVIYRLGGHTLVMDDGDVHGLNEHIRLRTAGGHQILMSDTDESIYIANSKGTVWMEFTMEGKIQVYSADDINIRTQKDVNLHSDKDINMFAYNDINMYAGNKINQQSQTINIKATTDLCMFGAKTELGSGSTLTLQAATQGTWNGCSELVFSAGVIHLNSKPAPFGRVPDDIPVLTHVETVATAPAPIFKWLPTKTLSSTVKRVVTHEPFVPDHPPGVPQGAITKTPFSSAPTPQKAPSNAVSTGSGGQLVDSSGNPVTSGEPTTPSTGVPADQAGPANAMDKPVKKACPPDKLAQQPPSTKGVGPLTPEQVTALKAQIAYTESNFNYSAENNLGYIGKYQFGAQALIDQGYVKAGTKNSELSDPSKWTGKDGLTSKESFINAPSMQEKIMDDSLQKNYGYLKANHAIDANSSTEDVAGKLASSHLVGAGGTKAWSQGAQKSDAYGTTAESYYNNGRYAMAVLAPKAGGGAAATTQTA